MFKNWIIRTVFLLAWLAGTALVVNTAHALEPVRIGVLAYRPKEQTLADWQPMVKTLKKAMPEREFVLEALDLVELDLAVAARQLHFVITNSGNYVFLKRRYDLSSPLATLMISHNNDPITVFGGVIFAAAGASQINMLADLKGKTIATVSMDSLGGYQMQAFEASLLGLHVHDDYSITTTGMPQDRVLSQVLSGEADVGFVRSGVLEAMEREGKFKLSQIKVINRQNLPGFPTVVSTRLYPEWPLAALPHIDEHLARHVTAALFLMNDAQVGESGMGHYSFVVPLDYSPVEDLLRELRLPPFDALPQFTPRDIWRRYSGPLAGGLFAMGVIVLLTIWLLWTNKNLGVERLKVALQGQKLQRSETRFRTLVERSPDPMLVHRMGVLLYVNSAAVRMFGATDVQSLLATPLVDLIHPDFREAQAQRMAHSDEQTPLSPMIELQFLKCDGTPIDVEVQDTAIEYDDHPAIHVAIRDITAVKEYQNQLQRIAHFDALTGLPNRSLMSDRLHQGMAQAQRRGQQLALAFLDLDGFKAVNDTYGHSAGDQLLTALATRMKHVLRDGDTLARLGGDEFVALLVDLPDASASLPMLERLLLAAAEPVIVGGHTLQVSASLGVTFYPQADSDVDADHLLRQADNAMYQAKMAGKNRYHLFTP